MCMYVCILTSSRVDFSISSKGSRASTCSTLACANKITRGKIQLTNNKLCIQLHLHVCIVYKNYVLYVCTYINNLHKHHDKHTHTHIHTHIYTYAHICIHTYINTYSGITYLLLSRLHTYKKHIQVLKSYNRETFTANRQLYGKDEALCVVVEHAVWVCA